MPDIDLEPRHLRPPSWWTIIYVVLAVIAAVSAITSHAEVVAYCIFAAFFVFVGRGVFGVRSQTWVAKQHYLSPDGTRFWSKGNAIATAIIFGLLAVGVAAALPPTAFVGEACALFVGVALARLFPQLLLRKDVVVAAPSGPASSGASFTGAVALSPTVQPPKAGSSHEHFSSPRQQG